MIIECPGCKKPFTPTDEHRYHCSDACKKRNCPVCGTEFTVIGRKKFCSATCRKTGWDLECWILRVLDSDGPGSIRDLCAEMGRGKANQMRAAIKHLLDTGQVVSLGKFDILSGDYGEHEIFGLPGVDYKLVRPVERPKSTYHGQPAPGAYCRQLAGWGVWR